MGLLSKVAGKLGKVAGKSGSKKKGRGGLGAAVRGAKDEGYGETTMSKKQNQASPYEHGSRVKTREGRRKARRG